MQNPNPVPVTVLTGYLGAGKTTLLNQLLKQPHGYKCALIINEFGPISIDNQLVIGVDEEIVELNNGCLCCRVRGDLVRSLEDLFQRRKRFDYVLIETTGLADPSPVVHTFSTAPLAGRLRLDGVVTVVDSFHLDKELRDGPEAAAQLAFADVVLLNKTDLVAPADLETLEKRIRSMNILARLIRTQHCDVDVDQIFNLRARELSAPLNLPPNSLPADLAEPPHDHASPGHDHDEESSHDESHHHHDEEIRSFYLADDRALDLRRLEAWLSDLVRTSGPNIYRAKGILYLKGQAKRVVFHGVQMIFDARPDRLWQPEEKKQNQLVFIGKDLDETAIRAGFERCVAD